MKHREAQSPYFKGFELKGAVAVTQIWEDLRNASIYPDSETFHLDFGDFHPRYLCPIVDEKMIKKITLFGGVFLRCKPLTQTMFSPLWVVHSSRGETEPKKWSKLNATRGKTMFHNFLSRAVYVSTLDAHF